MSRLWRAYHAGEPPVEGATLELDPHESHHVSRVLRLREGEALAVFDGNGGEWRAVVSEPRPAATLVRIGEAIAGPPVDPGLPVILYQALLRPELIDRVLQKATEVGVDGIVLVRTERSEPQRVNERRLERWRRILVESCKQSGRRRLPGLDTAEAPPEVPPDVRALALDPQATTQLAEGLGSPGAGAVWLLSGPRGGLSEPEVRAWGERGFRPVGLGPRVFRADTAGVVAATIVLHRAGDLG